MSSDEEIIETISFVAYTLDELNTKTVNSYIYAQHEYSSKLRKLLK